VATASNGAEALALLDEVEPALILLDMRMPVLDGWGVAAAIQRRALTPPIVVMTAAQDAAQWAEEINAAGYIAKPFDLFELLAIIERFQA
jgi:CheY-like chemotaxis protein